MNVHAPLINNHNWTRGYISGNVIKIRRDVFYITITLTERTKFHVSEQNALLSTRLQ